MNFTHTLRWFFTDKTPQAKRARRVLNIILVAILFIGLFAIIPITDVLEALLKADTNYFLFGLLFTLPNIYFTAVEIHFLTKAQSMLINPRQILSINLVVKFYNLFTPGSLVGSGIRWYRLSQPDGKKAQSLAAVAFFRLLENFLTVVLGFGFWFIRGQGDGLIGGSIFAGLLILTILVWLALTRLSLSISQWLRNKFMDIPGKLWQTLLGYIDKVLLAVSTYAKIPLRQLIGAILAGILSQLIGIISSLYLARSVGIELGYVDIGWINALLVLASQLPISIAGGLGVREVSLVALLAQFGISADIALAYSFLLFIRGFILSVLGGGLELYRLLTPGKDTERDG